MAYLTCPPVQPRGTASLTDVPVRRIALRIRWRRQLRTAPSRWAVFGFARRAGLPVVAVVIGWFMRCRSRRNKVAEKLDIPDFDVYSSTFPARTQWDGQQQTGGSTNGCDDNCAVTTRKKWLMSEACPWVVSTTKGGQEDGGCLHCCHLQVDKACALISCEKTNDVCLFPEVDVGPLQPTTPSWACTDTVFSSSPSFIARRMHAPVLIPSSAPAHTSSLMA